MSRLAALVFSASAHARSAEPTAATAAATLAPTPPPPREITSILARSSTGNALSAATASAASANARIASAPAASPPLASATHRRNASAVAGSDAALGSARSFSSIGSNLADANVTAALCGAYANAEDPSSAFAAEFEFEREPPPRDVRPGARERIGVRAGGRVDPGADEPTAGASAARNVRARAGERVDVRAPLDVSLADVLDDEVDHLLAVPGIEPVRLQEPLRGVVRVIAGVERELQGRGALLNVHVEDVIVRDAVERLPPAAGFGIIAADAGDFAEALPRARPRAPRVRDDRPGALLPDHLRRAVARAGRV